LLGEKHHHALRTLQIPDGAPPVLSNHALKTAALQHRQRTWLAFRDPVTHGMLCPYYGPQSYLRFDPLDVRVARASLRFGIMRTNATLHSWGRRPSPICSHASCAAAGVPDTCDHVLLQCPRFRALRNLANARLLRARIVPNKLSLLGILPQGSSRPQRAVAMSAGYELLASIFSIFCV